MSMPREHITPRSAFDNLHFKALALNTLFAWKHVGTANCLWAASVCRASVTRYSCKVHALHACSSLSLHFFPAALETLARSVDSSAYRQSSALRFHRIPCKTRCIQYSAKQQRGCLCHAHGAQKKPSFLKGFPQNQLTTKTETDWDVLYLFSFLSIFLSFTSDLVLS